MLGVAAPGVEGATLCGAVTPGPLAVLLSLHAVRAATRLTTAAASVLRRVRLLTATSVSSRWSRSPEGLSGACTRPTSMPSTPRAAA